MHFKSVFATLLTLFVFAIPTATAPSAERVQDLFGVLRTGNFTDFYALLSPSSTWDTIGFGVRTRDQTIEVFKEINCLLSNPPLRIETDLVLSQGWSSTHTSVKAHVPNGIIGTNGIKGLPFLKFNLFKSPECSI
jgi:hypothetical protein